MLRRFRCNYRGCLIVFNVLKAAWLRHFPCCAYIDGAVGPTGPAGPQGPAGPTGLTGAAGPNIVTTATSTSGFANGQVLYNNNGKVGAQALPSALKSPAALTISLNGSSQGAYDGSTAKAINITAAAVGALGAAAQAVSAAAIDGGTY